MDGLSKSEVLLVYTIDPEWLAASERKFPVTLDPTVCIQTSGTGCSSGYSDTYIGDGYPGYYVTTHGYNRAGTDSRGTGWGHIQTLMFFPSVNLCDTSGCTDDGAQIISASLQIHQIRNYGGTGTNSEILVDRVTHSSGDNRHLEPDARLLQLGQWRRGLGHPVRFKLHRHVRRHEHREQVVHEQRGRLEGEHRVHGSP